MGVMAGRAGVDESGLRDRLVEGVGQLALALEDPQIDTLIAYLGLLARWNRVYNLTAVRDPADMLSLHLLDSLSVLPLVRATGARRILDVGTGAGLPGIPLAICMPAASFDLVDAVAKKVAFLRQAKTTLALANLHPHHQRVEALTLSEPADLIISRAYADVGSMLLSIDRLASPATTVVAMKGAAPTDELTRLPAGWRTSEVIPLDVPGLGAQRCAVVLRRESTGGA